MTKADAVEHLRLTDTGVDDEYYETPLSLGEMPGWAVIVANDFGHFSPTRLKEMARGHRVIGCAVHEGVMASQIHCFYQGMLIWAVTHDGQDGPAANHVEGNIPSEWHAIDARLANEQAADGGTKSEVDYLFDGPIELGHKISGFQHNLCNLPIIEKFTGVHETGVGKSRASVALFDRVKLWLAKRSR